MMPRALSSVLLAALVVSTVASGCGSSDGDTPASGAVIPADQLVARFAAAACDYSARCSGTALVAALKGEDCATYFTKRLEDGELGIVVKLTAEGKLTYDAALAGKCVSAYASAACGDTPELKECDAIAVGSTKVGGACTQDEECGPKGYCAAGAACPGTCKARLPAEGPCKDGDVCEEGSKCVVPTQTCERYLESGAACTGLIPCQDGLTCVGLEFSKGIPGACGVAKPTVPALAKLGEACDPTSGGVLCEASAVCELQGALGPNAKFLCVKPYASGATCHAAGPDGCPAGEFCPVDPAKSVLEATCTKLPALGEPCAKGLEPEICGAAATCFGGKCVPMQRLGGECFPPGDLCYSGKCAGGVCVAPTDCTPPLGGAPTN